MFSACCSSWLWVPNLDSFVTPSTSWATSAPKRSSTSVRLYSVSSGTSWRSAASMATGSRPSSARIWADAIGWVTYGSPVARSWPSCASTASVEGLADLVEVGVRRCSATEARRAASRSAEVHGRLLRGGRLRRPRSAAPPGGRDAPARFGRCLGARGGRSPSAARIARLGRVDPVEPDQPYPIARRSRFGLGPLVPGHRPVGTDDRALVALAGQQDRVAGPSALEGGRDGVAPVRDEPAGPGRAARPAASAPAAIASRIACRSSPRGSSSVTTTRRQRSAAIRPMSGRFATSRSPAEPKTAITPPPRAAATGASRSSTVSSEAGLWA